jgi:PhzF family phenazine biosynthesis protein
MHLDFVTLDVFTTTRYEGNPLAIVFVPPHLSKSLTQPQKLSITHEFNFSETIFFHKPAGPSREWAIDIFAAEGEIPFAGHPTIGAASYILGLGFESSDVSTSDSDGTGTIIVKAGRIDISKLGNGKVSAAVPFDVHVHSRGLKDLVTEGKVDGSALGAEELSAKLVSIVKGMTFLLVRLPNVEALAEAHTRKRIASSELEGLLDDGWQEGMVGCYYYVFVGNDEDGNRGRESNTRIRSRMIIGTLEDPATGSASCALASYLALTGVGSGNLRNFEIIQGVEMGRRSEISIQVELGRDKDGDEIIGVRLAGNAVKVMEGRLRV